MAEGEDFSAEPGDWAAVDDEDLEQEPDDGVGKGKSTNGRIAGADSAMPEGRRRVTNRTDGGGANGTAGQRLVEEALEPLVTAAFYRMDANLAAWLKVRSKLTYEPASDPQRRAPVDHDLGAINA